ncbi:cytosine-specific methyltransferase [Scytonema sp. HK-05]|uniref:DNA cytosine methyltransferase n=1 Tax=Scytonema sp. HK-05 TaxID=1137095 RepID=UPI0009360938|nr:DNA cytosine methyltransferase [Scytonema sp. HK-05]OKH59718.1 DNA (cytosine-5-)-methyltransferase [Scytonema sp. HK-05]BAY47872.1 cytosine-specific methyltransferase [Scytonema sp. HK-05]
MNIVSLFSGCGGLDLGFHQAGFNIVWANEYDKSIWDTYEINHPNVTLDRRDIRAIEPDDIPDCIGIIGGPPCQSWSEAGAGRGINDSRGQLFFDYIRIIREKKPLFFLAENVSGILAEKHNKAFTNILYQFKDAGYEVTYKLLNAYNYGVPQDRKRVIIVGYREEMGGTFEFPRESRHILTLRDAIYDINEFEPIAVAGEVSKTHPYIPNHEYMEGSFSSIYMSRNRVRTWDEPSFTIQAGGRHAPIHPQAQKMIWVGKDKWIFDPNSLKQYRRLSVRECARIQTFPDDYIFKYKNIIDGYKMVGNAVPVLLAKQLATKIIIDIKEYQNFGFCNHVRRHKYPTQLTLFEPSSLIETKIICAD